MGEKITERMAATGNSKPPFDRLPDGRVTRDHPTAGIAKVSDGSRVDFVTAALHRALHDVLQGETPATWTPDLLASGAVTGRGFGVAVDKELAQRAQPALAEQPLEICLALAERHFAAQGWGVLVSDVSLAPEHGLVLARLKLSCSAAALGPGKDFADPMPAGFLQGFLEHVSGQPLGCLEIGCARAGAPECTFVITSAERLEFAAALIGKVSPDEIIERLKA
jgi:hypothetical protein